MKVTKVETFRKPEGSLLRNLISETPNCFNSRVDVEKYEITVVKIEEPKEVYRQRLQKLWEECDNHHHMMPLIRKAHGLGFKLIGMAGSKRKK